MMTRGLPSQTDRLMLVVVLIAVSIMGSLAPTWAGQAAAKQDATASPEAVTSTSQTSADLAPANTLLYYALNLDLESDNWNQATTLFDRAGLTEVWRQLQESMITEMSPDDLVMLNRLRTLTGGELALVVTDEIRTTVETALTVASEVTANPEGNVEEIPVSTLAGVAAIFQTDDTDEAWMLVEELLDQTANSQGATVEETTYKGATIKSVPGSDAMATPPLAIGQMPGAVAVAFQTTDLEAIVDTQSGDSPSLAEDAKFQEVRAQLSTEYLSFAYGDYSQLYTLFGDEFPQYLANLYPPFADPASLQTVLGTIVWADEPGFRFDTTMIPVDGGTLPALPENFDPTLDERVPSDTLFFMDGYDLGAGGTLDVLALSIAQAYTAAMATSSMDGTPVPDPMAMLSPEYADEQFAQLDAFLGFNLRDDFIHQMAGEYAIAVSIKHTLSPLGIAGMLVSGVDDGATLSSSTELLIDRVSGLAGDELIVASREVSGGTIHILDGEPDDSNGLTLASLGLSLETGVIDDQFIAGTHSSVEGYLEGPNTSLAENRQYQRVFDELPDEHLALTYVDLKQIMPYIQLLMATDEFRSGISGSSGFEDADSSCGDYENQFDAQRAYDEDSITNGSLDTDFDGEACEDYDFDAAPDSATPVAAVQPDLSAIESFGAVVTKTDTAINSNAILYIAE